MYLVSIMTGDTSGYSRQIQFATHNLEVAQKWVDKYNKIITDNSERLKSIEYDDDKDDGFYFPYLYFLVNYENPKAIIQIIKIK